MDKAAEASQQTLPPSYGEATTGQPGYPAGQFPPQPGQAPAYTGQAPVYSGQAAYPQHGYPGQYSTQYTTTQYTAPGQPGYVYSNVVVQQPVNIAMAGGPPQDHMCAAIFVTLCCFWPTGIIAILKASEARNAVARGDLLSANNSARSAKQMVNISVIVGIIAMVVMAIIIGLYVGLVLNHVNSWDYSY